MKKNYFLLGVIFVLECSCAHAQKLCHYVLLQEKALSYIMEDKNEKAIYFLKDKCLRKYPEDLRSMYLLAYLYDQKKETDSAYTYLTRMFQPHCGFILNSLDSWKQDSFFAKYADTSISLKNLMISHYQKAGKYNEDQKIDSVCQLLKKMAADDYFYRNDDNRPIWDSLGLSDSIVFSKGLSTEIININLLMCIIKDYGWPTYHRFGFEASENAFIIAQHSDNYVNFQVECLKYMQKELPFYEVAPNNYAYLLDRVCVNLSKKQYFGTQFGVNRSLDPLENDYLYEVVPLVNPEKVDIYRTICNMPSLEEYKTHHRRRFTGIAPYIAD